LLQAGLLAGRLRRSGLGQRRPLPGTCGWAGVRLRGGRTGRGPGRRPGGGWIGRVWRRPGKGPLRRRGRVGSRGWGGHAPSFLAGKPAGVEGRISAPISAFPTAIFLVRRTGVLFETLAEIVSLVCDRMLTVGHTYESGQ
jgi:hypothetical protein